MNSLKDLNLSDQDFKLLVDGLDALPKIEETGNLAAYMMMSILASDDKRAVEKIKSDREAEKLKNKHKNLMQLEDIKILQGKLLMLKRHLMEEGALLEANAILKNGDS